MTEIEVTGTVAKIIPPRDTYTHGQVGTARLHFTFDDAWQGYNDLKAIFDCGVASADAAIVNDECTVPQDVLATPYRIIQISISGNDGANAISTAWVRLGQVLPSGTSGGGGRFVTFDELAQMLLDYVTFGDLDDYVTKAELAAAIADLAKKDELDALTAAFDALVLAVDDKADKSELDKYVLKSVYDDFVQAVNDALDLKANITDLDDVWKKSEITLVTSGDGKSFLGNDGQYHVIQGGSGDAKAFIAEYNVTTAQEIIDFIDASNEPYAPMQVKRAGSYYTVVTAVKQDTDKVIIRTFGTLSGNYYMFTYTITGNVWASESYGFQPTLVSGTNIKTINGESLLGSGNIEIQGGTQEQADWNEADTTKPAYIKNKPDIPDVSGFATKESVQAVSDTVSTLSGTVINQGVAIQNLSNDKADKATLANYATTEYVDGNFAKTTDIPDVSGFETTAHAEATFAKKSEIPDVSGFETTQHANETFATKEALTNGLAGKVDTATLGSYETTEHADATFAKKSDIPDVSGFETTEHADATFAKKSDIPDVSGFETSEHAEQTYQKIADASEIKTIKSAKHTVTVESGVADVGGTTVSRNDSQTTTNRYSVVTVKQNLPATSDSTGDEGAQFIISKSAHLSGDWLNLSVDGVAVALKNEFDPVRSKASVIDTSGNGTLFLANDGTYRPASGDPPDLTPYLKKTEAENIYATIANHNALVTRVTTNEADIATLKTGVAANTTAIGALQTAVAEKAAASDVQALTDRVTAAEADIDALETDVAALKTGTVKSVTASGFTVTPDTNGNVDVGGTDVSRTSTMGSWGSEITYTIAQTLPTGATSDTKGSTLTVVKRTENSGATPRVTMTVDGVQLATSADVPDVSNFATLDYVQNTYETTAHAEATYLPIANQATVSYVVNDTTQSLRVKQTVLPNGANTLFIDADKDATNNFSNLRFVVTSAAPNGGGLTTTSAIRAVTYDEFTTASTDVLTKTEAAATYQTIADASQIKSVSAGGVQITPSATGNVAVDTPYYDSGFSQRGGAGSKIFDHHHYVGKTTINGVNSYMSVTYTDDDGFYKDAEIGVCRVATYDEMNAALTAATSPIKSITAGGETVAPDANGNVAIAAPQVSYSDATNGFQGWASKVNPDGTSVAFSHNYMKNGSEKTNLEFDIALVPAPGSSVLPTLVSRVRAVTWDEFTAQSSPIKSITYGGDAITPDANGNVALTKTTIALSSVPTTPPATSCTIMAADGNRVIFGVTNDAKQARLAWSVDSNTQQVNLATEEWVQQYVASLDGTNIAA